MRSKRIVRHSKFAPAMTAWNGPAVLLPRQQVTLARGAKDKEHAMSSKLNTAIAVAGIDIGKNSFHVIGLDKRGAIVLRQKWSRGQVEARLANTPPCLIGMEACVGAHHLSRKLQALGHDARLMPAKYVRPYSKGQKNDFRDAEAIAEAGCICGPTKAYLRLALRSAATWTFIMAGVRTRALTASRPIKPTSPRCHSAWQPDPGRGSTYRCGKSVQTTGTTSGGRIATARGLRM